MAKQSKSGMTSGFCHVVIISKDEVSKLMPGVFFVTRLLNPFYTCSRIVHGVVEYGLHPQLAFGQELKTCAFQLL